LKTPSAGCLNYEEFPCRNCLKTDDDFVIDK
jgi:hypothetical protein